MKIINSHIQALFFDLDGTLVDSSEDIAHAVNHMLHELHQQAVSLEQVQQWIGNGSRKLVLRALSFALKLSETEISVQSLDEAMVLFNKHYALSSGLTTKLYEGVKETLKFFHSQEVQMCVITNKPEQFTPKILQALGIEKYFQLVVSGDTLETKKPDPAQLFYAMDFFDVDPQRAVMIGDSKSDIMAAQNAGMKSVCVTYGYNHGEDPRLLPADGFVDRFEQLQNI